MDQRAAMIALSFRTIRTISWDKLTGGVPLERVVLVTVAPGVVNEAFFAQIVVARLLAGIVASSDIN